jgi:hypothetical protein
MRPQQDAAIVVDEMAQRRIEVLPGTIAQLRTVVRTDLRQLFQPHLDIRDTATLDLRVGETWMSCCRVEMSGPTGHEQRKSVLGLSTELDFT